MKKEVMAFRKVISGGRNLTLSERLKANGTVEEIRVRFYPGQQRSLQISPYVMHKSERREDLFTYPFNTETYLTGDNDYLVFPVTLDFEYDDEFHINVFNADYVNAYTLSVDVVVSYHGYETGV